MPRRNFSDRLGQDPGQLLNFADANPLLINGLLYFIIIQISMADHLRHHAEQRRDRWIDASDE